MRRLFAALLGVLAPLALAADPLRIATAANFKPAMDELVELHRARHPGVEVQAIYASTGKLAAQIREGAPFDLLLSADVETAEALIASGDAIGPLRRYARGRLVLWATRLDARGLEVKDLVQPRFARIAIAQPRHAPYGRRAEEALRAAGVWDALQPRLVYGENIAQTAQFVQSGNADIGLIALSQALDPALAARGGHALVPETLHAALDQAAVRTRRGAAHPAAGAFLDFLDTAEAHARIERHGYTRPPVR